MLRQFLEVNLPRQPPVVLLEVLPLRVLKLRVVWLARWLVRLRLGRVRFLTLVSISMLVTFFHSGLDTNSISQTMKKTMMIGNEWTYDDGGFDDVVLYS